LCALRQGTADIGLNDKAPAAVVDQLEPLVVVKTEQGCVDLARDQHIRPRGPDPGNRLEHGPHRPRLGDQARRDFAAKQHILLFELPPLAQSPAQLYLGSQDGQ